MFMMIVKIRIMMPMDVLTFILIAICNLYYYITGTFPNRDNPNAVQSQNYRIYVPQTPTAASSPACTPGGYIGMAINGAVFYNPLTSTSQVQ